MTQSKRGPGRPKAPPGSVKWVVRLTLPEQLRDGIKEAAGSHKAAPWIVEACRQRRSREQGGDE